VIAMPKPVPSTPPFSSLVIGPDERPAKIFVRAPNWVGDAVMATPALAHLRRQAPDVHVTLMARPWVAPIYEHNPDINELWIQDDASMGQFMAAVRRVRRERFDVGIALPNSLRAALLLNWGHVRRRYGYLSSVGHDMMLNCGLPLPPRDCEEHQVYYYLGILRNLCPAASKAPDQRLFAGELEREEVARLLRGLGLDMGQRLIGLAPGSINSVAKRWPAERFAEVADRLPGEMRAVGLLLGSDREKSILDDVQAHCRGQVHNLAGKINLGQSIALMESLMGLVTNDAGLMHVAAAMHVPTVAIFGPTEWNVTYPFSPLAQVVRKEGVECAPCMLRECPVQGHPCMTGVTIDMVMAALGNMIAKAARQRPKP
jgi:heptosyltransferase-2